MAEVMQARDVMSSPVVTTSLHATLGAAVRTMHESGIGHLVVADDNRLVLGVLLRSDLRQALGVSAMAELEWKDDASPPVRLGAGRALVIDAMRRMPRLVSPNESLTLVAKFLKESSSDCVIVAENRRAIGIITASDLVRAMASGQ